MQHRGNAGALSSGSSSCRDRRLNAVNAAPDERPAKRYIAKGELELAQDILPLISQDAVVMADRFYGSFHFRYQVCSIGDLMVVFEQMNAAGADAWLVAINFFGRDELYARSLIDKANKLNGSRSWATIPGIEMLTRLLNRKQNDGQDSQKVNSGDR